MSLEMIWGWINFPLGLLAAEYVVGMRLPKRKYHVGLVILGCLPSLVASLLWRYVPISGPLGGSLIFFTIFVLSMVMPILAFQADGWSYLLVGVMAYCAQHISYQMYSLFSLIINPHSVWEQMTGLIVISVIVYTALYFAFTRQRPKNEPIAVYDPLLLIVSGLTLLVTVVLSFLGGISAIMSGRSDLPVIISVLSIIVCLLSIMVDICICSIKKGQVELTVLKHILAESQKQYESSKENIDVINIKYHDLKHQLSLLEKKLDKDELAPIKQAIIAYDQSFGTGNVALDTVLAEKAQICGVKGIRLTCMIDGNSLAEMKQSDIYSLFGNALDNAIRAVSDEEESNRVISLREVKHGGFTIITIENYHTGEIVFDNGLPLTTHEDKNFHGFGMKSMKMIVEKYGGEMMASFRDHIFRLQIILATKE